MNKILEDKKLQKNIKDIIFILAVIFLLPMIISDILFRNLENDSLFRYPHLNHSMVVNRCLINKDLCNNMYIKA